MRTFRREDWMAASDAWHVGGFDEDTWTTVRRAAAARGMLYPPAGSRHDDVDAAHPSQRAIVYRAIDETPHLLLQVIARSSSWTEVVSGLIRAVNARRDEVDAEEIAGQRQHEAEQFAGKSTAEEILVRIVEAGVSHRAAQLEAIASAARDVVRLANQQGLDDEEWEDALTTLEGLLLALGDGQ